LYGHTSWGSLAGEGSAAFVIGAERKQNSYAKILGIELIPSGTAADASSRAMEMLRANNIPRADLLIAGYNGDADDDKVYDTVATRLSMHPQLLRYKHMCGEFGTASAFALWMGAVIVRGGEVPEVFGYNQLINDKFRHVLLYNHYRNQHHSLILLAHADV
jgi:hypothetical protein